MSFPFNFVIARQFWQFSCVDLHTYRLISQFTFEMTQKIEWLTVFSGRHPELSSPSHLSHPSAAGNNGRIPGLFSHFYDGQRQPSHFPRTSGKNKFCCALNKDGNRKIFQSMKQLCSPANSSTELGSGIVGSATIGSSSSTCCRHLQKTRVGSVELH